MATAEFVEEHLKIVESLSSIPYSTFVYTIRHFSRHQNSEKMSLQSYGAELVLKSTEYKAMDDDKQDSFSSDLMHSKDETQNDEGLLYKKLLKRFPLILNNLFVSFIIS
jgi:hypothetical protein